MRIYPAIHYTMGGLWVDYNLMSTIPGLFVIGEANFSDHGANRLGASALMQGLADGYFVAARTPIGDYLATHQAREGVEPIIPPCREATDRRHRHDPAVCSPIKGKRTVDSFHRELGKLMWEYCGMARNAAGWSKPSPRFPSCARSSGTTCNVLGSGEELNQALERAGRVADFLELGELICLDALRSRRVLRRPLPRGTPDARRRGAARRREVLLRRRLGIQRARAEPDAAQGAARFEYVHPAQRSYK